MSACGVAACGAACPGGDLCPDHRRQLQGWLHAVPQLAAELQARSRGLTRGGCGGGGNGEVAIPWNDGAHRVLDDFVARVRMSSGPLTAARHRSIGEAVGRAEDYLTPPARWFAGICSAPLPVDEDDEDAEPQQCTRDLYARGQVGHIRCPSCGAKHDVAGRRAVLIDRVDDTLVALSEFVLAAPELLGHDVRLDRVKGWVKRMPSRGRRMRVYRDLRTSREHLREVDVYRFGDLRERAIATRRKRAADAMA